MLGGAIKSDEVTNAQKGLLFRYLIGQPILKAFSRTTNEMAPCVIHCTCEDCVRQGLRANIAIVGAACADLGEQLYGRPVVVLCHSNTSMDNMNSDELRTFLQVLQRMRDDLQRCVEEMADAHFEYNTGA